MRKFCNMLHDLATVFHLHTKRPQRNTKSIFNKILYLAALQTTLVQNIFGICHFKIGIRAGTQCPVSLNSFSCVCRCFVKPEIRKTDFEATEE